MQLRISDFGLQWVPGFQFRFVDCDSGMLAVADGFFAFSPLFLFPASRL